MRRSCVSSQRLPETKAQEQWGECTIVLDNAAYHKWLTSPKDRLGYWSALKADDVLEAWKNSEVWRIFES